MRAVARIDVHGALLWLGVAVGILLGVGGCSTDGGESSDGVVSAAAAQPAQISDAAIADPALSRPSPLQSPPAVQDEDNLDPFGSLPIGIGFDTYTAECDPIADPYATCL